MDKNKTFKLISQIVFFGALWGLAEATLGYVLHFLPPTISGLVMFPIAVFILMKAYKATGRRSALIFVGFIAAGIKAVDFLLPGMMVFKTINPMISIVLESLVVAVAYPMLCSVRRKKQLAGSIGASLGWRTGYIIYMLAQFLVSGSMTKFISTPMLTVEFILLNGIISGFLVYGVLMIESKAKIKAWKFKPIYAVAALALAMGIQLVI